MTKWTIVRNLIIALLLVLLILQLNIYFAWTSHVAEPDAHQTTPTRLWLVNEVNLITKFQLSFPGVSPYFAGLAHHSGHYGSTTFGIEQRYFIDYEVVAFTLIVFALSLLLFSRRGIVTALLRAVEITSAAVLPLGIEIYLYDYREFYIHASVVQVKAGLAWITNADFLYITAGVLATALAIDLARYARGKRRRAPVQGATLQVPEAAPTAHSLGI